MRLAASFSSLVIVASIVLPSAALAASSPSSYVQVKGMKTSFVAGSTPRIFVSGVEGAEKLVAEDGWQVDSRIRRPNDSVTSIDVRRIAGVNEWTLYPDIPSEPGDYLLRVMFYCGASFHPCAANGTMVNFMQDIPFMVTATKGKPTGKTLKFPLTSQATTAAQVTKDDGLTEAELATLLLKKETGGPSVKAATIEGEGCSQANLWIDVRTAKGKGPDSEYPTNVRMYDYMYFSAAKNYGAPAQWQYLPHGDSFVPYIGYGVSPGKTNVHLLEAREGSKSAWKLLTVMCEKGKLKTKLSDPAKAAKSSSFASSAKSSSSKSSSSKASSVPTADWKTFDNASGVFSIKLPKTWKGSSEYDGSDYEFTKISDFGTYHDPKGGASVFIQMHSPADVNTQGKTMLQFAEENMVFTSFNEPKDLVPGDKWTMYTYAARKGSQAINTYTVLFATKDDTMITMSFPKKDAIADEIVASFKLK